MKMKGATSKLRRFLHHKEDQYFLASRKFVEFICLIIGAGLVAAFSYGFAELAEFGYHINVFLNSRWPWICFILLPFGLMFLVWFTRKFAPYVCGSGIPQVIASIEIPPSPTKEYMVRFWVTLWKIPLTFLAMVIGGSVGREGPSVQVGAAVMLAWGKFCRKHHFAFKRLSTSELMAAGAAGGLAAAFNAPLAGVVFAIEELGKGTGLRWDRGVLLGVLATGFLLVLFQGNNPYFPVYQGAETVSKVVLWVLLVAVVNGIFGGIFARLLSKGLASYIPSKARGWVRRHPIYVAFFIGIILAVIGMVTHTATYGTGYDICTDGLSGEHVQHGVGILKLLATVGTYWSGIAGGIFTPALATGAGIGAEIANLTGGIVDQRFLVLLSMSAFLAAATQAPVTSSTIVMEMTGSQPELVWVLACSLIASLISHRISAKAFYHFAAGRFVQRVQEEAKLQEALRAKEEEVVENFHSANVDPVLQAAANAPAPQDVIDLGASKRKRNRHFVNNVDLDAVGHEWVPDPDERYYRQGTTFYNAESNLEEGKAHTHPHAHSDICPTCTCALTHKADPGAQTATSATAATGATSTASATTTTTNATAPTPSAATQATQTHQATKSESARANVAPGNDDQMYNDDQVYLSAAAILSTIDAQGHITGFVQERPGQEEQADDDRQLDQVRVGASAPDRAANSVDTTTHASDDSAATTSNRTDSSSTNNSSANSNSTNSTSQANAPVKDPDAVIAADVVDDDAQAGYVAQIQAQQEFQVEQQEHQAKVEEKLELAQEKNLLKAQAKAQAEQAQQQAAATAATTAETAKAETAAATQTADPTKPAAK